MCQYGNYFIDEEKSLWYTLKKYTKHSGFSRNMQHYIGSKMAKQECSYSLFRSIGWARIPWEKNGSAVSNGNSSGHIHFTSKGLKQSFIV